MKKKLLLFVIITVALIACGFFYYAYTQTRAQKFWVAFLNIGQGDSALIHFADNEKMLVDCGPDRTVLSEIGKELPFWDRDIDVLLVTHPDRDHYGGCIDVLTRYNVKKIVTNGRVKPYDAEWVEFDKLVKVEGAEVIAMTSPTVWTIAGDSLEFLSPDPSFNLDVRADDSNNYSIVFRLVHNSRPRSEKTFFFAATPLRVNSRNSEKNFLLGDLVELKKYLFTGDMEIPLENALFAKYCDEQIPCAALQADVLKVGHHGSPGSTSEEFLNTVTPKEAIVSVGKNKFGHPSERVIKKLERVGAKIRRTDKEGAIVVE